MDTSETKLFQNIKNYNKIFLVTIFSIILYILAAVYNDSFYFMIPTKSYLTWHMVLEVASVLVSFSIFTVTYFIYEESSSLKVLILGCSFLLMAWLDIFHTFSYRGMPYFFMENITSNRATILWVLSRLFGSLGFLLSLLIPSIVISNVRKEIYAALTSAFAIILFIIVTYFPNFFPAMYIEGEGLTNIKILLEYFIILLLGISFIIASNRYKKTNAENEYRFMVALVLLMFTEFSFTRYGSTYDAFNYIGHIYKILAYSIFYKALYISNVTTPFREMKKAKDKLKDYSDNLNMIVHQRTEELEDINKILLNDLDYAKEMQRCFLPEQLPEDMSVTFHAEYLAADSLSGDFYNVVKLDENNIAIYIGDVSGHGVSAAMLTVFAYQNIIHLKRLKQDGETGKEFIKPAMVLGNIFDSFNKTNINDEKYIVMLYGIYNIKNKTFEYASAGINVPPYIIKKSGEILEIDARGFPICKFGDFFSPSYENRSIQLETGDKLLFYSDGLVDAKNKNGEIFGHNKLIDILKTNISLNSKAMNIAIKGHFYNHIVHVSDLMDDVTFLTMSVEK